MTPTSVTLDTQRISSVLRQILAGAAVVMAAVTQADSGLHLPVAISTVLGIAGAVILAIEHYVSDPSTGTSTVATPLPARQVPPV